MNPLWAYPLDTIQPVSKRRWQLFGWGYKLICSPLLLFHKFAYLINFSSYPLKRCCSTSCWPPLFGLFTFASLTCRACSFDFQWSTLVAHSNEPPDLVWGSRCNVVLVYSLDTIQAYYPANLLYGQIRNVRVNGPQSGIRSLFVLQKITKLH